MTPYPLPTGLVSHLHRDHPTNDAKMLVARVYHSKEDPGPIIAAKLKPAVQVGPVDLGHVERQVACAPIVTITAESIADSNLGALRSVK